jgi:hypothetical protein
MGETIHTQSQEQERTMLEVLQERSGDAMMNRYLVESPHTEADCKSIIQQIHAAGYLYHFDWGCADGVHCGWAVIEADCEDMALLAVPPLLRKKANITRLVKFDIDQNQALHTV